jgi:hypothetical protein
MSGKIIAILALLVLVAGIVFAFFQTRLGSPQQQQTTIVEEDRLDVNELGFIQGSLSFPSEVIPSNMLICAEEVSSGEEVCTANHIAGEQFTYSVGYSIAVRPGTYEVYAYLPEEPERRAYYNEFVVCGLSVECESHAVIPVQVEAGKTVTDVDPQDWYQVPVPEDTATPESFPEGQI